MSFPSGTLPFLGRMNRGEISKLFQLLILSIPGTIALGEQDHLQTKSTANQNPAMYLQYNTDNHSWLVVSFPLFYSFTSL